MTTGGDVAGAKIADDGDSGTLGNDLGFAKLERAAGAVENGLAVAPDELRFGFKPLNGFGVLFAEFEIKPGDFAGVGFGVGDGKDSFTQFFGIGEGCVFEEIPKSC